MFVSFQDFVGKTRNFSAGVVARFGREEEIWAQVELDIGILFIDELLVISESRKLDF